MKIELNFYLMCVYSSGVSVRACFVLVNWDHPFQNTGESRVS